MLGPYYEERDKDLTASAKRDSSDVTLILYASELLAGLINRAVALGGALFMYEAEPEEMHEILCAAVTTFLEDVSEARIRGRRARLFAGSGTYAAFDALVNVDFAEGEKSLAKIGGALVPE